MISKCMQCQMRKCILNMKKYPSHIPYKMIYQRVKTVCKEIYHSFETKTSLYKPYWSRFYVLIILFAVHKKYANFHSLSKCNVTWWHHQMETFSALLALCEGNHQWLVDPPHKALMFFFICAWTNGWANNRDTSNLRCHCAHCDVM